MSLTIRMFPALNGDCILIRYGKETESTILIDGGYGRECRNKLIDFFEKYKAQGKKIDLVAVTHIDADHITGICDLFSWSGFDSDMVKEVWFHFDDSTSEWMDSDEAADTKISWKQGVQLEELIRRQKISRASRILSVEEFQIGEARFIILNPDEETLELFDKKRREEIGEGIKIGTYNDYEKSVEELGKRPFEGTMSLTNQSSIAFLMEYHQKNLLFLGDAPADKVERALRKLGYSKEHPIEAVCCKIAHHASRNNTSDTLLELIRCRNYLISTNLTSAGRPSKECLSRIILHSEEPVRFYCNYDMAGKGIFTQQEMKEYGIEFITKEEVSLEDFIDEKKSIR